MINRPERFSNANALSDSGVRDSRLCVARVQKEKKEKEKKIIHFGWKEKKKREKNPYTPEKMKKGVGSPWWGGVSVTFDLGRG